MAYDEYLDLYIAAQENPNAKYYVVSFDVIDSKKMPSEARRNLQLDIETIMKYVYEKLLEKEKELNREIVIKDDRFIRPWDNKSPSYNGNFIDPSIFGDNFQFTVLRGTVSKDEIIELVNEIKRKLNFNVEFHISDGYYETNEYAEGGTKFYRGYCLQTLERLHKPNVKEKIKRLESKKTDGNE